MKLDFFLFLRYMFLRELTSKKGPEVAKALEEILIEMKTPPKRINSDRGT